MGFSFRRNRGRVELKKVLHWGELIANLFPINQARTGDTYSPTLDS
jgi:hypothetical protein